MTKTTTKTPSKAKAKAPAKSAKPENKLGKLAAKATKVSKEAQASHEAKEVTKDSLVAPSAEEIEDAEDAANETAARAAGGSGPPAQEVSITFKNFRHHPDMENFYRFIYENDLRFEALDLITKRLTEGTSALAVKTAAARDKAEKKKQKSSSRASR